MIRYGDAIRFDDVVKNGRTEPLRINIECDDGSTHDTIVKVSVGNAVSLDSLVNEMLSSLIAADLGLPVNEPFFVRVKKQFIEALPDVSIANRLRASNEVAFGSMFAGTQWRRWEKSDKLKNDQRDRALEIFAFDGFIENADRKPSNSNLLVKGDDLRLIDHELAFDFLRLFIPSPGPWSKGSLESMRNFGADSEHVFCSQLENMNGFDFDQLKSSWKGITDARLDEYEATLPTEWAVCRQSMTKRLDRVKEIRDRIVECETELKRVIRHA